MKPAVDYLFTPPKDGFVPYWRLVLRGFSQICFQSNELTGFFFFAAVLVASPISAAYLLVAGLMAPAGRKLLGDKGPVVLSGAPGLNPGLIALSLPAFLETGWTNYGMWAVLVVCLVLTLFLVSICLAVLPFPTLALPFLIVFWGLYGLAPYLDVIQPLTSPIVAADVFRPGAAVVMSLGQAIFSPTITSGILFGIGVFLSNWRHGVLAVCGAVVGTAVAYYYANTPAEGVNLGLYGFNGVLTAVAVYVICGGHLRLAILGAVVATMLTPAIATLGLQALSAPFVFTTWLVVALGWIEEKGFDETKPAARPNKPT